MAYILKRDKAIAAIEETIKVQDNDLLQRLYADEVAVKKIGQAEIFKLWHGFIKTDSLPDESLDCLLTFFEYNHGDFHDFADFSHLIFEYAETIENENSRYLAQNSIKNFDKDAQRIFKKDLPQLTKDEVEGLVDFSLTNSSPSTIQRAVKKVSAFCDWCIKNDKIPNAVNNFKHINKLSYEPWVRKCLIKDDIALVSKFRERGLTYDEGRPGPLLLALAWMGFNRSEVLDIKNEDVDFFEKTVCGRSIPELFKEIFMRYDGGVRVVAIGRTLYELQQEDLGYFVKRQVRIPNGQRFDDTALMNAVFDMPYSYENIWLSGILYRLYVCEQNSGVLTDQQIRDTFQVTSTAAFSRYRQIYETYKKCFWENA